MPNATLKAYAQESGKSMEQVEKAWEAAKTEADGKFKEKNDHYWAYVTLTTRRKLGIDKKRRAAEKTAAKQKKSMEKKTAKKK